MIAELLQTTCFTPKKKQRVESKFTYKDSKEEKQTRTFCFIRRHCLPESQLDPRVKKTAPLVN